MVTTVTKVTMLTSLTVEMPTDDPRRLTGSGAPCAVALGMPWDRFGFGMHPVRPTDMVACICVTEVPKCP